MVRGLRLIATGLLLCVLAFLTVWGSLALWFQMPGPTVVRLLSAGVFAFLGLAALAALLNLATRRWLLTFGVAFGALAVFWASLVPPVDGDWSPELTRQVSGTIEADTLTLRNVRDFEWRSDSDFTEVWTTESYDLGSIETVDLYMSYWGGPTMAHLMTSFGFADGRYLAWSVEVRRSVGGEFSPVGDFFKSNPIAIVASEEKDVVGLRSNIQKADVYMFRLDVEPDAARRFLEEYVRQANRLTERPRFFNSVFSNCSMTVLQMAKAVGADLPFDWRLIVNGYLPDYLYRRDAMNSDLSLEALYDLGDITEHARGHGLTEGFSEAIRVDVPNP